METLKGLAFGLCAAVFLFGMLLRLIPRQTELASYAKTIVGILLILLIFKGIYAMTGEIRQTALPRFDAKSIDVTEQLALQTQKYVDQRVREKYENASCRQVKIKNDGERYEILSVDMTGPGSLHGKIKEFTAQLCGISEEKIHVAD